MIENSDSLAIVSRFRLPVCGATHRNHSVLPLAPTSGALGSPVCFVAPVFLTTPLPPAPLSDRAAANVSLVGVVSQLRNVLPDAPALPSRAIWYVVPATALNV